MVYDINTEYLFDNDFVSSHNNLYSETYSLFNEPRKINYYKVFSLSHNTYTFLLNNRRTIETLIKNNRNILQHLFKYSL